MYVHVFQEISCQVFEVQEFTRSTGTYLLMPTTLQQTSQTELMIPLMMLQQLTQQMQTMAQQHLKKMPQQKMPLMLIKRRKLVPQQLT